MDCHNENDDTSRSDYNICDGTIEEKVCAPVGLGLGDPAYNENDSTMKDTNIICDDTRPIEEKFLDLGLGLGDPPEGGWYFESDHPLLKSNPDYKSLLKTLAILEAQRIQTLEDHATLGKIKEEAMKNPVPFMEKLLNGEDVGFPKPMEIAEIPRIDWSMYRNDRQKDIRPRRRVSQTSGASGESYDSVKEGGKSNAILVRGRAFDVSKPVTFNQLWTEEEQERLEELLIEFPSEEVEQNRYKKIAAALGNRTHQQVASRIQKYFIKLYKAGLPIPGRPPRVGTVYDTRVSRHHHQKYNRMLFRPTTFFPQMPPLLGNYNLEYKLTPHGEIVQNYPPTNSSQEGDGSEDELLKLLDDTEEITDLPEKLAQAKRARVLRLLEKVTADKRREVHIAPKHYGHKCCYCKDDPLEGTRWHCQTCPSTAESVDFCTDCVVTQLESSTPHPISHRLVPITTTCWMESGYDQDYAPPAFAGGDVNNYNYLDPNFLPS